MDKNALIIPGMEDATIPPGVAIAAVALNMAINYTDSTVVKDGTMYQQLKLDNKTITGIDFDDVLDLAKRIEIHLVGGSDRIAGIVVDAINHGLRNPIHPGEIILSEIFDPRNVKVDAAAVMLNFDTDELAVIVAGDAPVTEHLAGEIERVFNYPAKNLLEAQKMYDEATDEKIGNVPDQKE